jgi:hypothetical protein
MVSDFPRCELFRAVAGDVETARVGVLEADQHGLGGPRPAGRRPQPPVTIEELGEPDLLVAPRAPDPSPRLLRGERLHFFHGRPSARFDGRGIERPDDGLAGRRDTTKPRQVPLRLVAQRGARRPSVAIRQGVDRGGNRPLDRRLRAAQRERREPEAGRHRRDEAQAANRSVHSRCEERAARACRRADAYVPPLVDRVSDPAWPSW